MDVYTWLILLVGSSVMVCIGAEQSFRTTVRDFLPTNCMFKPNNQTIKDAFNEAWDTTGIDKSTGFCTNIGNEWVQYLNEGRISGHPDFQTQGSPITGAVKCSNPEGLPVGSCKYGGKDSNSPQFRPLSSIVSETIRYSDAGIPKAPYCDDTPGVRCGCQTVSCPTRRLQSNQTYFEMWYNDNPKYNRRTGNRIPTVSINENQFEYDSLTMNENIDYVDEEYTQRQRDNYGPVDRYKYNFGAYSEYFIDASSNLGAPLPESLSAWPQTIPYSNTLSQLGFWQTTEMHTFFEYRTDRVMQFAFSGDDDFWAYVNGRLVIDLGGIHSRLEASIDLKDYETELGLRNGQTYTLDIFHAERQTTQSNFKITTSLGPGCNVLNKSITRLVFDMKNISTQEEFDSLFGFSTPGINFNSVENEIQLSQASTFNSANYIFTKVQENVGRSFATKFKVRIDGETDGFAFVIQSFGVDNYPSSGQYPNFNLEEVNQAFAIVFDICKRDDPTSTACQGEELSIHFSELASGPLTPLSGSKRKYASISSRPKLSNGDTIDVEIISYGNPAFIEVYIDDSLYLRESDFDMNDRIGTYAAHVGFTSTTSSNLASNIFISDWTLQILDIAIENTIIDDSTVGTTIFTDGITESGGINIITRNDCELAVTTGNLANLISGVYVQTQVPLNGTQEIVVSTIIDNNDGTYTAELVSDTQGSFDAYITVGEGCNITVDDTVTPVEVTFSNATGCFNEIVAGAVETVSPGDSLFFRTTVRDFLPTDCMFRTENAALMEEFNNAWGTTDVTKQTTYCSNLGQEWLGYIDSGEISGHPDFETYKYPIVDSFFCDNPQGLPIGSCKYGGLDDQIPAYRPLSSIVSETIGHSDAGVPKAPYCSEQDRCGCQFVSCSRTGTQSNKFYYDQWFNDNPKYNRRSGNRIPARRISENLYRYDSLTDNENGQYAVTEPTEIQRENYGPLDRYKYDGGVYSQTFIDVSGNIGTLKPEDVQAWPQTIPSNNYLSQIGFWQTTEIHSFFEYRIDRVMNFSFSGDDDFWAYVNGKLAIDLGGIHPRRNASINLHEYENELGLEHGRLYTLDIFHAERQTRHSNFQFTTSFGPGCNVKENISALVFDTSEIQNLNSSFSPTPGISLNEATSEIQLSSLQELNTANSIYTREQILGAARSFAAKFKVRIGSETDGFAFVVQSSNPDSNPQSDQFQTDFNYALQDVTGALAIVFNLCKRDNGNSTSCNGEEVSLHYTQGGNAITPLSSTMKKVAPILSRPNLSENKYMNVEVVYYGNPNYLDVYIDDSLYIRESSFNLVDKIGANPKYVGLTATTTGNVAGNIFIQDWSLQVLDISPMNTVLDNSTFNSVVFSDGVTATGGIVVVSQNDCGYPLNSGDAGELLYTVYILSDPTNGTQQVVIGETVDNGDGTYTSTIVTEIYGSYDLYVAFGNGCNITVDQTTVPATVTFENATSCYTQIVPAAVMTAPYPPSTIDNQEINFFEENALYIATAGISIAALLSALYLLKRRGKGVRNISSEITQAELSQSQPPVNTRFRKTQQNEIDLLL